MFWFDIYAVISVLSPVAKTTGEVARDWFFGRFLANFDVVLILTALRMWSQQEHRKTAEALRVARQELADAVASTAAQNARSSSAQNAVILQEVQANTAISTQAFEEANSVNQKIASLREDQNALQSERNEDKNKE